MTLVVKQNVATNPIEIAFLSAVGIVLEANSIAHLVKEFFGTVIHNGKMRRNRLISMY